MYVMASLLRFVASVFIAIGDFVLSLPPLPSRFMNPKPKPLKSRTIKSGTFKIRKTSSGQQFKSYLKPVKTLSNIFFGATKTILLSPLFLLFEFLKIVLFPAKIVLRGFRAIGVRSAKNNKRNLRIKNGYHKPTLLYKLKYVFIGFIFSFIFLFLPLASFLFVSDLPNLSDLSISYIPKTTKIFDRNGTLLYEIYANQNRTIVKLTDVPKNLRDATIAIEDKDFYSHPGFDLRGIIRAFIANVKKQGFQGGSTITQQLIKSAFLTPDPTVVRKIKEVALAFWAERIYSKNQILELYLNYVPYGGTAWGIQSAADIYFGKKVQDLDLAESAFLAGLPQSPSVYSPYFGDGTLWKKRQKEVLDAMVKQGYITKTQAKAAAEEQLSFNTPQVPLRAPHFVMYIRNLLIRKYGLSEVERGGLTVKTSLDLSTQDEAEQVVADEVNNDTYLNISNGAALITDPSNGDILAMVGSKNYFDTQNDGNVNLTTSLRQPGSSIKLVTYTLALSSGYTEATILDDSPLTLYSPDGGPSYSPVNYDGAFHGRIPLRTAFANSFNIPPVRIALKLGATTVKNWGEKMGVSSWNGVTHYGVSITLGGVDVRMTDMVTAYGTIANGGKKIELDPFLEIKDSYGNTVYKKNPMPVSVIDPGVAYIASNILADNNARSLEFGTNSPLNLPGTSVKTGTTDNKRDNWTIGYTPKVVVATWVGNNDNSPMNPALASGITGAAPMWHRLMTMMLDKVGSPSAAIVPPNVVKKYCMGMDRYFLAGTENSVSCSAPPSVTPTPAPATN